MKPVVLPIHHHSSAEPLGISNSQTVRGRCRKMCTQRNPRRNFKRRVLAQDCNFPWYSTAYCSWLAAASLVNQRPGFAVRICCRPFMPSGLANRLIPQRWPYGPRTYGLGPLLSGSVAAMTDDEQYFSLHSFFPVHSRSPIGLRLTLFRSLFIGFSNS